MLEINLEAFVSSFHIKLSWFFKKSSISSSTWILKSCFLFEILNSNKYAEQDFYFFLLLSFCILRNSDRQGKKQGNNSSRRSRAMDDISIGFVYSLCPIFEKYPDWCIFLPFLFCRPHHTTNHSHAIYR